MRAARLGAAAAALLAGMETTALAHRLDEYLQATTLSLSKGRVRAEIRLAPGVAVARQVLSRIDRDGDGALSRAELRAYGDRVLHDLSLMVDGEPLRLRLVDASAAPVEDLREGLGAIRLELEADVPGGGPRRRLVFENRHQPAISAYLVNCLAPRGPEILIRGQDRSYEQSRYVVAYVDGEASPRP